MKKNVLFLFLSLSLILCVSQISCTVPDDDIIIDEEIQGRWQLIEIYADPGGGGDFIAVDSDKVMNFLANGDLESNGYICSMSVDADTDSFGTYSTSEFTISSPDCPDLVEFSISFQIIGDNLIISYPCIEPCEEKYIKID